MNEKKQALSSPLFKALAEIAFSSVMVTRATNEHGASEIVYVNDQFTELTGYGADEVMGGTPGMLQGPKTDAEVLKRLEKDLIEDRVIDIDGVTYYIAVQREAA